MVLWHGGADCYKLESVVVRAAVRQTALMAMASEVRATSKRGAMPQLILATRVQYGAPYLRHRIMSSIRGLSITVPDAGLVI